MNHFYKRTIAALLAGIMTLSLCACGGSKTEETVSSAPEQTSAVTAAPVEKIQKEAVEVTPEPTAEPKIEDAFIPVGINEVMASNKSTLLAPNGEFCDWVELYNYGSGPVDLSGYGLCINDTYCPFGSITMQAGEYLIVYCSVNTNAAGVFSGCALSKKQSVISIQGEHGTVIEKLTVSNCKKDTSYYRDDSGAVVASSFPTPGYANDSDGYAAYQDSLTVGGPLIINEAMTYNNQYYMYGGSYYDWLELKNISDSEVLLSDYYLSDKSSDLLKSPLPEVTLAAGATCFVYCSGDETLSFSNGINANFALSSESESVFLSSADGEIMDYVSLHDIPYGGSAGRVDGQNGTFYFTTATPNAPNSTGYRSYADTPVLKGQDGVYNDVESVTVTLEGSGTIYYTTNGSTPTSSSTLYTGPFEVTKTTPVRAIAVEEGKMDSRVLNLTYVINENHVFPVVSIMADYNSLFGAGGIYTNPALDKEILGAATFYENGGSFAMTCGIKLHGATSKMAQDKKSFKLNFRSRYEGALEYDLFQNGITEYSSILVRAAQEDYYSTLMRDTLMHQIAVETFPELPSQDTKYSVLYVNGEYWGIYDIREAHSEAHYANHYGYDEDTVSQWKFQWPSVGEVQDLYNFIMNKDLTDEENWNYVKEHVNLVSIADWSILEAYSGNFDCNPDNMRFYYSTEDGKLTYALVDLDLGFFSYDMFDIPYSTEFGYGRLATRLLNNEEFRQLLISELHRALTTTLSDESVLARIDALEEELTPEIPRDRARWGSSLDQWQRMVEVLRNFVRNADGRAGLLVTSLKNKLKLSNDEVQQYFSDVE